MAVDRYAVIGNPVQHSRSPDIHAQFARSTGQVLSYERVLSPLDGFAATVRAFAAAGGRGCNVTVPFKFEAFELAQHRSARAELARSVNTLRFDAGGWFGDNTDGVGLVNDIERNAGVSLRDTRVLLLGAGGAGAGALGPLLAARPRELVLANRTLARAVALAECHRGWATEHGVRLQAMELAHCGEAFDVVVNATASSLHGDAAPVDAAVLRAGTLALDMMYGPAARGFLQWATRHGAVGRDGLGMLVEQAAQAFYVWRGVQPETGSVLARLRAQVDAEP